MKSFQKHIMGSIFIIFALVLTFKPLTDEIQASAAEEGAEAITVAIAILFPYLWMFFIITAFVFTIFGMYKAMK